MNDESKKASAEQIFRLSEEVSRIAERLARLSTDAVDQTKAQRVDASRPDIFIDAVRSALKARRLRTRFFADTLFADPAWDMMLGLLEAELLYRRVTVTALSEAAGIPPTTAIRWINSLVEQGLFVRRNDPLDARRVFVELSKEASKRLRQYFLETA